MTDSRAAMLIGLAVLLGLVVAGSFYVGAAYACGDGYREGLRCVEPERVAVCTMSLTCFGVSCPPNVEYGEEFTEIRRVPPPEGWS